jgi:uncharacterized protein YndB with AHSA1/START domain
MITNNTVFNISDIFEAPRDVIWKAWTDNEQLKQWFGPKGCPIFHSKLELKKGGTYHYGMNTPDGGKMWGKWVFQEITPPERLIFTVSFSDESGKNITHPPMEPNWPLEILSTITFEEKGNHTEVVVQWIAQNATDKERETFEKGQESMKQGWTGTFEQLSKFLAEKK